MKILDYFHHHHDLKKGIIYVVIGWFCLSTMYMLSKLLADQTSVPMMLFFRSFLGVLFLAPWIIKELPQSLKVVNLKTVIIRSVLALFNLCFIFLAVQKISLINATLLSNSAPFFVPFIVWFWLRIPIDHKHWPAIIVGFIGIALILHPDRRLFNIGAFYGILSGITLAFILVLMRLTSKSESLYSFMLYFSGIGGLISLPFAIYYWQIDNWCTLLGLIGMGVFATLGQVFLYYALKHAKARQLAPFMYSSVIFSGIYEWLIWGHTPRPVAYLGMLLIIGAGAWIVYVSRPKASAL